MPYKYLQVLCDLGPRKSAALPSPTLSLPQSVLIILALLHEPLKLIRTLRSFTHNILSLWNILPSDRHITSACTQRSAPQRKPPYLKHRISPLYPVLLFFIVFITIKSILYICLYLFASVPNKFQKGKNSVLFTTLSFPLFTEDVL